MIEDKVELWLVIFGLGLGSFGLRFLFLGLVGDRTLPAWLMRHLRYTPVAILPALVAPLVLWPTSTDGEVDPGRILAAFVALAVGYVSKNVIAAILSGAAAFAALAWIGI